MKLQRILFEIKIDDKGFWISPQGKIFQITGNEVHASYALKNFKSILLKNWHEEDLNDERNVSFNEINDYMVLNGFTRFAADIGFNTAYFEINEKPTRQVLETIKNILIENNIEKVLCYFVKQNGTKYPKEFNSTNEFFQHVNNIY